MISKIFTSIIIVIIIITCMTVYYQYFIIYPGMYRTNSYIFEKPFEEIDKSFYKKGISDKLWVILGGNNSIPNDFRDLALISEHSFLLISYPGYNLNNYYDIITNKEFPSPESTYNQINKLLDIVDHYKDINFGCYSIGCAVGLHYVSKIKKNKTKIKKIKKIVLIAPFWSIEEVASYKYILLPPELITPLLYHTWNNFEYIKKIPMDIDITIIHGKNDETTNFNQGLRLSKLRQNINFILTEDDHSSIKQKYLNKCIITNNC